MRKLNYFVSLAAAMLLASCSSDLDDFNSNNEQRASLVTIGVGMPGGDGTRVEFNNELQNLVWSASDNILIEKVYGDGWKYLYDNLTIKSGEEGKNLAIFTGTINDKTSYKNGCRLVYVGEKVFYDKLSTSGDNDQSKLNYRYQEQSQAGFNNFAHIQEHLFLTSPKMDISELFNTNNNVLMSAKNSILKLNVKELPTDIKTATDMEIKFYVNEISSSGLSATTSLSNASFNEKGNNYVYFAFDPAKDLNNNTNSVIAFEFIVNGVTYTAKAAPSKNVDYLVNKIYTATIGTGAIEWEKNEGPQQKEEVLYERSFENNDFTGWSTEGTLNINGPAMFWHPAGMYLSGTTGQEGIAVCSEEILLKTANKIQITSAFMGNCPSFGGKDAVASVVIRNVGGSWQNINGGTAGSGGEILDSGALTIPDTFNETKVQIGLRYKYHSDYDKWLINNIKILGK